MGIAVDTVLSSVAAGSATFTATAVASGDSFQVRNFAPSDSAQIVNIFQRAAASASQVRIRSPLLYDNVEGLQYTLNEAPAEVLVPGWVGQNVEPADTLIVEVTGATTAAVVVGHEIYYQNLPGAMSRLYSWSDIQGNIKNIKGIKVAVTASGTIGAWSDTVITTTENLLHAGTDHAVLGYTTDTALAVVGWKGQETNNLRVCGPGSLKSWLTSGWFVRQSQEDGKPWIPVFNANNRSVEFASVADNAASTAANLTFIVAELAHNLQ